MGSPGDTLSVNKAISPSDETHRARPVYHYAIQLSSEL